MPASVTFTHLSPVELSYLHTSLSSHPPIRPDSRLSTDFRPLNAEVGVLPNTMGSAHAGFADGREAVVGVRAEVEKTPRRSAVGEETDGDVEMNNTNGSKKGGSGRADWVTLSLTLPGIRDDDKDLVFLEEMLKEVLVTPSETTTEDAPGATSLPGALIINDRWHWHLYIDVLLISAPEVASSSSGSSGSSSSANYPLPLLSMAIYLALRDTRIPKLKSEGEEEPVADDDWDAAVPLYPRRSSAQNASKKDGLVRPGSVPPVTLLVMSVAENVIFDPSAMELAVADGVWAISIGRLPSSPQDSTNQSTTKVLTIRSLETSARDTMRGVPRDVDTIDATSHGSKDNQSYTLGAGTDQIIPGVWKPKVGGVKRAVVTKVLKAVLGSKDSDGVGSEILSSLDGFLGGAPT